MDFKLVIHLTQNFYVLTPPFSHSDAFGKAGLEQMQTTGVLATIGAINGLKPK